MIKNKIKIIYYLLCIVTIVSSCTSHTSIAKKDKENFAEQFFTNKLFYGAMKKNYPNKNEIFVSDPDHLISEKSLVYSNREIVIKINDNNLSKNDLYLKYYIINSELAYVVFWTNTIEGISFVLVKSKLDESKWNIFDVTYRNIR